MALVVGVDTGGTFTDLFALDETSGRTYVHKTPSTPENPAKAIVEGIAALRANNGLESLPIRLVAHGTTVATNALLERNGARVSLVTTEGFRDLLEIGRQTRPLNYDMQVDRPPPVVPRPRRHGIAERLGPSGEVVVSLEPEAVKAAVSAMLKDEPQAIAICLLFAYLNPQHELAMAEEIRRCRPDIFLSLSSEVQPEFREYERFSATAINAYLQPVMGRYLDFLQQRVRDDLPGAELAIGRSNGGLMSLESARQFPIRTALSGPAAGVVGALDVMRATGVPDAITFDMGGTSTDVSLLRGNAASYRYDAMIGSFPVRLPMMDIHTIGAGGGSIAWLDRDDLLKVGPRSAGAVPGPACYGKGGTEPTVSDANAVLGRLSPKGLLDGKMSLDLDASRKVVAELAAKLGLTWEATARGIIDIVVANMVRAVRTISIERGFDPRNMALIAFGGAGSLHARDVAAALDMSRIIVPAAPGILCATGLLHSPFKEDLVRTVRCQISDNADLEPLVAALDQLHATAAEWIEREELTPTACIVRVRFDMRYQGQNFELSVPFADGPFAEPAPIDTPWLLDAFYRQHELEYGYFTPGHPVEVVNVRLTVEYYAAGAPGIGAPDSALPVAAQAAKERRLVHFASGDPVETPVYNRASLRSGHEIDGPAIVDQLDATTLIFPGDRAAIDQVGNLVIEVSK